MEEPAVLILAAGLGTRMNSKIPKVLHKIMGKPLIAHVLNAAHYLNPKLTIVITGYEALQVEKAINQFKVKFVRQKQQLGTGHAVAQAKERLAEHVGLVLIMPGDAPLISPQTLMDFKIAHETLKADLSVLTAELIEPGAYGRVIRDQEGWLEKIVEAKDATKEELMINEINSGIYLADNKYLFQAIEELKPDNKQAEYYLTDIVASFRNKGLNVAAICGPDAYEVEGINNRLQLAQANLILKAKTNEAWMLAGVTMEDPNSTYIEASVKLGTDVTLAPQTILKGKTTIGSNCHIDAFCLIENCQIEDNVIIGANSTLRGVKIKKKQIIEPHSHLRENLKTHGK